MIIEKMPVVPYIIMCIILASILIYYIFSGKLQRDFGIFCMNMVGCLIFCIIYKGYKLPTRIGDIGVVTMILVMFTSLVRMLVKTGVMKTLVKTKIFKIYISIMLVLIGFLIFLGIFF